MKKEKLLIKVNWNFTSVDKSVHLTVNLIPIYVQAYYKMK